MKGMRWSVPLFAVTLPVVIPFVIYLFRPSHRMDIAVLDKTVPFFTYTEHRSLFWLLNHLKIRRPEGRSFAMERDYFGAYPPEKPGDPPRSTADLPPDAVRKADLVYLADTYGVYTEDLRSGRAMKAALERSRKIYGGFTEAEADAVLARLAAGKTLIAEFNTMASPTGSKARQKLEQALGVRWTRWIGRYFNLLEDTKEVPQWLRDDYEHEWKRAWTFTGPGYVLVQDDAHVEVLTIPDQAKPIGLRIQRRRPIDPVMEEARDGIPYPYWFDIVVPDQGTEVLAEYSWRLTKAGFERLSVRGLPGVFPAVTRRRAPGQGTAYYFAGDYADNPMAVGRVPLAGYIGFRRALEVTRLRPSETAFFWRFYAPMVTSILEEIRTRKQ